MKKQENNKANSLYPFIQIDEFKGILGSIDDRISVFYVVISTLTNLSILPLGNK